MRLEQLDHVQSYYQLRPRTDVSEDVQPDASDAGRLIDCLIARLRQGETLATSARREEGKANETAGRAGSLSSLVPPANKQLFEQISPAQAHHLHNSITSQPNRHHV